ncbi:MAG: SRPBCC family protein [Saprospiraceae bacterium]|nr:SRPBCC family protein [Saprospiraceae bacterium]
MKIVKNILIGLVSIIVLLLIVALFVPKQSTVSVALTIDKPKTEVYDYIRILRNQDEYSSWVLRDPNLKPEIVGEDGTVGAIQKWNSKDDNVGEGEQEITALTPDRIDVDLRFKRPFEGTAKAANILKAVSDNQTEIISEFYSNDKYPFNLMFYLFGRNMIKDAEMTSLQNIKRILEAK